MAYHKVVLGVTETTGSEFNMPTGKNLLQVRVPEGSTFPSGVTVTLQSRNRYGEDDLNTEWENTSIKFSAEPEDGWEDVIYATSRVDYRLVASAAGVIVYQELIESSKVI